jgi:hypothetical protein
VNCRKNQQGNRRGSCQAMNDPDHQRPHTLVKAEAADRAVEQRLRLIEVGTGLRFRVRYEVKRRITPVCTATSTFGFPAL